MTKLALIDLDGVVADSTERFKRAEEAKQVFLSDKKIILNDLNNIANHPLKKEADSLYWQTAFTPELVSLDTLIVGATEALEALDRQNWQIIYLTSRPESMRQATVEWLNDYDLYGWSLVDFPGFLIMKTPAFQFVKTVTWKAGMVQTLASLYGANEVLFVDGEGANVTELVKYSDATASYRVQTYNSLQEAVEALS